MKKNLRTTFSTRQYMLSNDFEVYYYNDTNMSNVSNHSHNYYEFYFFIGGNVSIEISNQSYSLTPGDMILIPPNVKHHLDILDAATPYQRFIFWISQDYCNHLLALSPDYVYLMQHTITSGKYIFHFDYFTFNSLQNKLFSLIEEMNSDRFGKNTKIMIYANDLIFSLNRAVYEMEHPNTPKEELSLCQNLIAYIDMHMEEDLSLDILSAEFYVSKYHIAHTFKDQMGISVHQYIQKKRLRMSRDAILGHTEISEAFLLCGFKDYSSFFRAFKKEYGMSPKEFKELYEQEQ